MIRTRVLITLAALALAAGLSGQDKEVRWRLEAGTGFVQFRDPATSPLIYGGVPAQVGLGWEDRFANRTSVVHFQGIFGALTPVSGLQGYSSTQVLRGAYSELFEVGRPIYGLERLMIGARLDGAANVRINNGLMNNSFGFESPWHLGPQVRLQWDVSRYRARSWSVWRLRKVWRPVDRRMYLDVSPALVQATYRNGYAYVGQGSLLNNNAFLEEYQWRVRPMGQWAVQWGMRTELATGNAVEWSYSWRAYSAVGVEPLQWGEHLVSYSLWFRSR